MPAAGYPGESIRPASSSTTWSATAFLLMLLIEPFAGLDHHTAETAVRAVTEHLGRTVVGCGRHGAEEGDGCDRGPSPSPQGLAGRSSPPPHLSIVQ